MDQGRNGTRNLIEIKRKEPPEKSKTGGSFLFDLVYEEILGNKVKIYAAKPV